MANENGKAGQAAIFKKVKKGGEHAHHGGVWKLAYADFVTAMMAFFLLMWLLNVTSEEMKSGIAQYFSPESVSSSTSGSGDVFFGLTISVESPMQAQTVGSATIVPIPEALRQGQGGASSGEGKTETSQAKDSNGSDPKSTGQDGDTAGVTPVSAKEAAELRTKILEEARRAGLRDITGANLDVVARPDGLLIEIIDAPGIAMFEIGSSRLQPEALRFVGIIAELIRSRSEPVAILGHTDSRAFASTAYTNWELAADRANAARRVLHASGVSPARIQNVASRADRMPRNPADPLAAENRRIEILLQRE